MQKTKSPVSRLSKYSKTKSFKFFCSDPSSPLKICKKQLITTHENKAFASKNSTNFGIKLIVKEIVKVSKIRNRIKTTEIYKEPQNFADELPSPIQQIPIQFVGNDDRSFILALSKVI